MPRSTSALFASCARSLGIAVLIIFTSGSRASAAVPRLGHVIVVVMENKSYDQVRTQTYISSLINQGTVFTNSYAVTHPSLPNYIALWAATTMGVTTDACPPPGSPYTVQNLGHACEAAGLTWRSYSENLPSPGSTVCSADNGLYTRKHDPWTYFSNLNHLNERPYSDLAADMSQGRLPRLAFVVPNNDHNMHDGTISKGDAWLSNNVPSMVAGVGSNGMVVLTWDEDNDASGNHILTVFVGPPVKPRYVSTATINHYGVVRVLCECLGLTPFGGAASQPSVGDVWVAPTPVRTSTWGRIKTLYR
jgi:hypothetical protein